MNVPDADDIDSEFQVLDEDYDEAGFYGGAFEASHVHGDLVLLRLYSIVPDDDGEKLRIETRHHYAGRVLDHRRTEHELAEDGTVAGSDRPLAAFCREHHHEAPREELAELVEQAPEH